MTRSVRRQSGLRPKTLLFAGIAVMTAYVLYHNERFLIEPSNPAWQHYAQLGWLMLVHGLAGASALLLAPMQFSERLRRKYTRLHRVVGRIYVGGALILAPMGAYIQHLDEVSGLNSRSFTVLALVDAILLMTTTAIAFAFALKRKIRQHRQWMTRSYAVALVFFEARFISGVGGWDSAGDGVAQTIIWCCLVAAVPLADVANELYDRAPARAAGAIEVRVKAVEETLSSVEEST